MKLFLIMGNQLFNPKYLQDYSDHTFYMAEDNGLCTFEKHHKLKITLFLSSMRSFRDELRSKKFKLIYKDFDTEFKNSYEKKLKCAGCAYIYLHNCATSCKFLILR